MVWKCGEKEKVPDKHTLLNSDKVIENISLQIFEGFNVEICDPSLGGTPRVPGQYLNPGPTMFHTVNTLALRLWSIELIPKTQSFMEGKDKLQRVMQISHNFTLTPQRTCVAFQNPVLNT